MIDHARLASAFAAARDYDGHARIQREVAQDLAARAAALPLPAVPRVLEIGCGTGFLTEALAALLPQASWLVTDLAPAMVKRCAHRMAAHPAMRFATLDGEYGEPEGGPFDLVVSSLALQWFDDPVAALARMRGWLAPGGQIVVATLGAGSFAEWREAHRAIGLEPGTPAFLPADEFAALSPAELSIEKKVERHADARAFLRALKAIGAGTAREGHRPLVPAALRKVMTLFEKAGSSVSYEVVTVRLEAAT